MKREETICVINLTRSTIGHSHKLCNYTLNRDIMELRLRNTHMETLELCRKFSNYKRMFIEDINFSLYAETYGGNVDVYEKDDFYYAVYDVLASLMTDEVRLTQLSFHKECEAMVAASKIHIINKKVVEIYDAVKSEEVYSGKRVRGKSPIKTVSTGEYIRLLECLKGGILWLVLKSLAQSTNFLAFWDEEGVLGVGLDDFKVMPLTLNRKTYDTIYNVMRGK